MTDNWIEKAKARGQIRKGAYGHHSAAQISRDSKKGGKLGKRARLAKVFRSMNQRGKAMGYGK